MRQLVAMLVVICAGAAASSFAAEGQKAANMIAVGAEASGEIRLVVHKSKVITTTRQFKQLSVGAPDMVDVNAVSSKQILITGRAAGETTLTIVNDDNETQTVDVIVTKSPAATQPARMSGKWELATSPIGASEIPGFVRFNFKRGAIHVAMNQIASVVVEDQGEPRITRVVLSSSRDNTDLPQVIVIPAELLRPVDVITWLKSIKESP